MTDKPSAFADADTNPQTAYELGRHDEKIAQAAAIDGLRAENARLRMVAEAANDIIADGWLEFPGNLVASLQVRIAALYAALNSDAARAALARGKETT